MNDIDYFYRRVFRRFNCSNFWYEKWTFFRYLFFDIVGFLSIFKQVLFFTDKLQGIEAKDLSYIIPGYSAFPKFITKGDFKLG